jgi:hypothetical protein
MMTLSCMVEHLLKHSYWAGLRKGAQADAQCDQRANELIKLQAALLT